MNSKYILFTIGIVLANLTVALCQPVLQFSTNNYSVPEWAGSVTLSVVRLQELTSVASVDYATSDGTATDGLKYTATHGTLTFGVGETNQSIAVPILNEGFVKGFTKFTVSLSSPSNAVLGNPATAEVNIRDTDTGIQFQFAEYNPANGWSWAEDAGAVQIGVVRGDDVSLPVRVDFATSDLTGTNGVDYIGYTNTLSFAPTERIKFVPVILLNNTLKQPNRRFKATLSNPDGVSLGTTKSTIVTILDNDPGFQFATNRYDTAEDAGVALISIVRGTDDTNSTFTVAYSTSDRSATSGADYIGVTNTLSFGPGETVKRIAVPILNNGTKQGPRRFDLALSNPTGGAVLGTPAITSVFISDNDPGVGFEAAVLTNSWNSSAEFSVTILRGNDGFLGPITVDYATSDATAVNGVDYQAISGALEFKENETVKNLPIPILRPRANGSAKSFRVVLSNPTPGVELGTATTTVKILGSHVLVAPPFNTALTIGRESGVNVLRWTGDGTLQRADHPTGPWQTLAAARSPCSVDPAMATTFYRVTLPRPASLYVPSSYNSQTNLPLVLLLHGYGGDPETYESAWKIEPLAETRGFLCCYPKGPLSRLGLPYWNGTDINDFWSDHVDDAGYLRALIQEISKQFAVDRKRIAVVGHSTGGEMAFTMACHSADLVASIVSLAGNTYLDASLCQPTQPVNILCVWAKTDQDVNYYGGTWGLSSGYPGAMRSVQTWASYNGARDPITDPVPSLDIDTQVSGLDTEVTQYQSYPPGGAVELWSVRGGSHQSALNPKASAQIIDWLLAHPKP